MYRCYECEHFRLNQRELTVHHKRFFTMMARR
jgi:hypothetical protein